MQMISQTTTMTTITKSNTDVLLDELKHKVKQIPTKYTYEAELVASIVCIGIQTTSYPIIGICLVFCCVVIVAYLYREDVIPISVIIDDGIEDQSSPNNVNQYEYELKYKTIHGSEYIFVIATILSITFNILHVSIVINSFMWCFVSFLFIFVLTKYY